MRKTAVDITKNLLIFLLLILPAYARSQTLNDAITVYNAGADLIDKGALPEAITKFEECIKLATKLGAEGDDVKTKAQNQIPNLYFKISVDAYKTASIDETVKKFEETITACDKYGNNEIKNKSLNYIGLLSYTKGTMCVKNEDYTGAIANFDRAIEIIPVNAKAYYGKTLVYRKIGDENKMLEFYGRTIEAAGKSGDTITSAIATKSIRDYYYAKARLAIKKEVYDTAFIMLANTLEYDSTFAEPYYLMAVIYNKQQEYDKAVEKATKAIEHDGTSPDPYYLLAVIYNKQQEYDKAVEKASKALELEPDTARQPKMYFELGNAYMGDVDYDKACEAFKKCLVEPFEKTARYKMENVLNCK